MRKMQRWSPTPSFVALTLALALGLGGAARASVPTVEDVMCAGPFLAESPGEVPADGPVTVAGVELPPGRRVADGRFWITDKPMELSSQSSYQVWAELAANFSTTGLWPVLWPSPNLDRFARLVQPPRQRDAEELLTATWDAFMELMEEDGSAFVAPFGATFPGLTPLQTECRYNAVDRYRDRDDGGFSRLALVPVKRPADVPMVTQWNDTDFEYAAEVSVVLRSWEDRFGAYLVSLAPGGMDLTVERPPRDKDDQWTWTAELLAFNRNYAIQSENLADYVALIVKYEDGAGFWWD